MTGAGSSSAPAPVNYYDDHRPRCHLAPPAGWMNDPNGPVFYKGRYHMFYQHLPDACEWDFGIVWGHAVSTDLVHWEHLPPALSPTPGWVDADGCFSGCCIVDPSTGRPVILYTGVRLRSNTSAGPLPPPEHDLGMVWIESQCAAVPADPNDDLLIEWKKVQSPFLALPPSDMELTGWRDPFAFCISSLNSSTNNTNSSSVLNPPSSTSEKSTTSTGEGGGGEEDGGSNIKKENETSSSSSTASQEFRILMGSGIKGKGGTALIYRSTDLMQGWELEGTLCEGNSEDSGVVWECPLLVPLVPVPAHQRSKHQHVPPPWLHQPSHKTMSHISSDTALRDASPSAVVNQQLHQIDEEKEKPHAAAGGGAAGTTSSLGGRFARRAAGIFSPPSASSSPLAQVLSSPLTGIKSSPGNSKEGSPNLKNSGGGVGPSAASPAAKKPQQQHEKKLALSPKTISTAVKGLFQLPKKEPSPSKSNKTKERTNEDDEFEFNSSGAASPGAIQAAGTTTTTTTTGNIIPLDRQGSIEMWPISPAEAASPNQEADLVTAESYQSIPPHTGPSRDFPVHELAEKLERAATLEHWNTQSLGPAGALAAGVAINGLTGSGNGGGGGGSRQGNRPNSRLSALLDGVPEGRPGSVAATIGSRLDVEEFDEEDEEQFLEEENKNKISASPASAPAPAAIGGGGISSSKLEPPPPAVDSTYSTLSDDINEDRFAMAFSRVPALTVKKKSAASLGLLAEPPAPLDSKQKSTLPLPAKLSTGTTTTAASDSTHDLLSSYSTDMTPMHQHSHILSTSQQTSQQERQWHFFTISPDAPTNPVLYWTGFVSHDIADPKQKIGSDNEEEDAGDALETTNNITNSSNPPPQFEINSAKGPFRLDLGDILYAPNVCQDAQGRWILWGWLQERRKMGTYSYAGCLSLPRVLHATDEGRLVQAPAPEVVSLRQGREFHAHHVTLYPESMLPLQRVSGDRLDIECTIERGSALAAGLLFRSHEAEAEGSTAIVYDWDRNHLEAIFNVPPNWQPCALPQVPQPQYPGSAKSGGGGGDEFSFTEEDLIGLGDAIHFDPAAYLCTPRYPLSRTPSTNVFSPEIASSPHAPLAGGGGGSGGISGILGATIFGAPSGLGGDSSPPLSSSSPVDSPGTGFLISGGMISEIGGGLSHAVQRQGSSLQQCLQRSSSYASIAGGTGIAGAVASAAGGALERGAGALGRTSSVLGTSMPRVGSFIQRQSSFLAVGSPRSQAIIDAADAAEMDAELSTLLEDLAAPMRGAGEEGAAPQQNPEPRRVGGPLLMRPSDKLHLRIFVDHSLVEVFTGTGEVLSTRIYRGQQPQSSSFFDGTGQVDAGIEFVAFGGAAVLEKVSAYEVGSAWKETEMPTPRWGTPTPTTAAASGAGGGVVAGADQVGGGGTPGSVPSPLSGVGKSAAERADELFDELLMGF